MTATRLAGEALPGFGPATGSRHPTKLATTIVGYSPARPARRRDGRTQSWSMDGPQEGSEAPPLVSSIGVELSPRYVAPALTEG